MDRCDVLIVGGGPAGSSLAWGLRGSGLDVRILDRRTFPRDKTCAGWITPAVLAELAVDPEIYAKSRVLQPIHGFEVRRMGDRPARVCSQEVISYGIRRCELDTFLLERSEAHRVLGEPLRRLEPSGEGWRVNEDLEAKLVVGAGGHFCPVARRLKPDADGPEPIVAAQEVEFRLDPDAAAACPVDASVPELFFTADLRGYGWVFRKGDWLNVGLGRQDRSRLAEHLKDFLAFLEAEGRLRGAVPDAFHGHAYLLYGDTARPLVAPGLALIGDAAGLAYPRSGEGIRPAVESGLLLARELRVAGRPLADALAAYATAIEARFGARQTDGRGLTDWLPEGWTRALAGWLFAQPWFARRVVVDRWFTHAHEAPLPPG